MIFASRPVKAMASPPPRSPVSEGKSLPVEVKELVAIDDIKDDAGVVVMVFPPRMRCDRQFARSWHACKMWFLETFYPVLEEGSNSRVSISSESVW